MVEQEEGLVSATVLPTMRENITQMVGKVKEERMQQQELCSPKIQESMELKH